MDQCTNKQTLRLFCFSLDHSWGHGCEACMPQRRSIMSIAPTLQRYLTAEKIPYGVIPHDPTMSSARTAEACRISEDCLAKAIVLRRDAGYMLAVLPASHHLRLSDLKNQLGDNVEMAKESEIPGLRARRSSAPRSVLCAASRRRRQHRGAAGDLYGGGRSRDATPYKSCAVFSLDGKRTTWPL
jgi:hypothetical protein